MNAQGRPVAVKIALEGEDEKRGLRSEREALKGIHQRITSASWLVPILDEGELPDGRPFLVLPWVEHSMQSWLRARQPDLRRRLRALVLTAEAVVQLHRSGATLAGVVLHRDLKPGNLLIEEVGEDLRVMLADLGGAKERTLHGATRNTGIHTPWFAPLEQALPLERAADPSVDVHALAVVIYSVLVGRPPQAVMSRTGLLTQAAEDLVQLHQTGGGRTPDEKARYIALRRAPLEQLIELDQAVALPDDDCHRLRQAIAQHLSERGDGAEALAEELTGILVPPLRHALDPNPRQRLSRAETLLGALSAAFERVPAPPPVVEVVEVETRPAPPAPPPVPRPASPPASVPRPPAAAAPDPSAPTPPPKARPPARKAERRPPWRLVAILGIVVGLVAVCAALIALPTIIGDHPVVEPVDVAASAAPLDPVAAVPHPPTGNSVGSATEATAQVSGTHPAAAPRTDDRLDTTVAPSDGQWDVEIKPETQVAPAEEVLVEAPLPEPDRPQKPAPPSKPPEPSSPPRLVISMDPRRGSSPYVWLDGTRVTKGEAWQGPMESSTLDVAIRETAEGPPRSFTLRREVVDATHWRIILSDDAGHRAERVVSVPAGGTPEKVLVQWCQDDAVRFGC